LTTTVCGSGVSRAVTIGLRSKPKALRFVLRGAVRKRSSEKRTSSLVTARPSTGGLA
jgi:hypothetical protein